jgi:hypothetical protein
MVWLPAAVWVGPESRGSIVAMGGVNGVARIRTGEAVHFIRIVVAS